MVGSFSLDSPYVRKVAGAGGILSSKKMKTFGGAVLAGGRSSRMGRDKALLLWEGEPLIQRVVEVVTSVCDKVSIIACRPKRFSFLGLDVYPDEVCNMGPLGGIYTALRVTDAERVFCVACDMPFLDAETIRGMLDMFSECDVVIPWVEDRFHPLHAVYSRSCIGAIEKAFTASSATFRVTDFFDRVKVKAVSFNDFPSLSPTGKALVNINTPNDLKEYSSLCH